MTPRLIYTPRRLFSTGRATSNASSTSTPEQSAWPRTQLSTSPFSAGSRPWPPLLPAATFLYILHTHRVEWLPESGLGILAGAAFSLCALGIDR